MAFLRFFSEAERPAFLAEERGAGGDAIRIRPEGIRDHYAVIVRIEPSGIEIRKRLGTDILATEVRREVALRARDSGGVAISRGLRLITDSGGEVPAFLMFKAVYRRGGVPTTIEERQRDLVGFIGLSSRFQELIATSLPPEPRDVAVSLRSPLEFAAEGEVYSEVGSPLGGAGLVKELPLSAGGQVWKVHYQARPGFVHPLEKWGPLANLLGGLLASGLLFALTSSLLQRRQRAEALARSMTASLSSTLGYLNNILDSATQVAIVALDLHGIVRLFNRGAEQMLGWSPEEVIGLHTPELWHDPVELEETRQRLLSLGLPCSRFADILEGFPLLYPTGHSRVTFIARGGERRTMDLMVARVQNPEGKGVGFMGISIDLTQQVAAEDALRSQEEQLHQSQKMDAIGQLAGGVAHDFNNMLAGILGSAELLAENLPEGDPRHGLVRTIIKASGRAADLTSKLLAFSRKGKLVSTALDLHRIVQDTLALLERSIDKRIQIRQELKARSPQVVGDPSQLENALLNLCINARDAMPEGGVLTVETEDLRLRESFSDPSGFQVEAGPYVRLSVRDTGHGIPPEIRDRIFEPFFTTKAEGKGTGLGLAAVYGIVKGHRGALQVESAPGQGSAFSILLPVDDIRCSQPAMEEVRVQHRGEGTILVIDDEDMIRSTTARILASMGYEVLLAADGSEGLRLFEARRPEIQLVLMDLVMPGLTGRETFRRLRALDPELRVVAASGFADDQSVADMVAEGLVGFLHKPYGMRELADAIHAALAAPDP